MTEIGSVETASAGVHLDLSWFKIIPSMSVAAKEANDQVFGEPIIDAQRYSSGREVVAFSEVIVANADEITPTGYPDAPPVLWSRLQHRLILDHGFPGLFFDHAIFPFVRRRRFVDVEVRGKAC